MVLMQDGVGNLKPPFHQFIWNGTATPAIAIPKAMPGTAKNRWNKSTCLHKWLEQSGAKSLLHRHQVDSIRSKYKEMIPCHCPTNPVPTAAKTQTSHCFQWCRIWTSQKSLQTSSIYSAIWTEEKKKKKSLFYSPLLTKAFPCELDQAFLCNMEWHWSIGYFPPLLHQIPLSRKH